MKHLTALLSVLLLILTSCINSDTIDGEVVPMLTDIVTFEGNSGGGAVFSFNASEDSPLVTLTADTPLSTDDFTTGNRVLLYYRPTAGQGVYASGPISIVAAGPVNNGEVKTTSTAELDGWDANPVFVYSMWRSGAYINLHCRLPYYNEPRRFGLATTSEALKQEIVDLYLVHQLPEPVNSHDRAYYASFDISAVWSLRSCRGVRVHVANSNLPKDTFEFLK